MEVTHCKLIAVVNVKYTEADRTNSINTKNGRIYPLIHLKLDQSDIYSVGRHIDYLSTIFRFTDIFTNQNLIKSMQNKKRLHMLTCSIHHSAAMSENLEIIHNLI